MKHSTPRLAAGEDESSNPISRRRGDEGISSHGDVRNAERSRFTTELSAFQTRTELLTAPPNSTKRLAVAGPSLTLDLPPPPPSGLERARA